MTLKIDQVSKRLGAFSLRNISLEVAKGEYVVLLGPTGAGKTVLLELVMGFHRPDKGKIFLNRQDITGVPTEKRGVAYVPQLCPLFPHLNVFENVEFGLRMRKVALDERKKVVDTMLGIIGLGGMAERMPLTLSGGERQKVVLARVLVTEPKVVLLDEPLTAIDAETSRSLRYELKRINREFNVAFLHVTHDQIEAFSLADRIAIMNEGEIVQGGAPSEVFSNPTSERVAKFLGYENVLGVNFVKRKDGFSEVDAGGISIKLVGELEDGATTVAIHPGDVMIVADTSAVSAAQWNVLEGEIEAYANLGPIVEVTVAVGFMLKMFVDKRSFVEMCLSTGKRVHVAFKAESVRILSSSKSA